MKNSNSNKIIFIFLHIEDQAERTKVKNEITHRFAPFYEEERVALCHALGTGDNLFLSPYDSVVLLGSDAVHDSRVSLSEDEVTLFLDTPQQDVEKLVVILSRLYPLVDISFKSYEPYKHRARELKINSGSIYFEETFNYNTIDYYEFIIENDLKTIREFQEILSVQSDQFKGEVKVFDEYIRRLNKEKRDFPA